MKRDLREERPEEPGAEWRRPRGAPAGSGHPSPAGLWAPGVVVAFGASYCLLYWAYELSRMSGDFTAFQTAAATSLVLCLAALAPLLAPLVGSSEPRPQRHGSRGLAVAAIGAAFLGLAPAFLAAGGLSDLIRRTALYLFGPLPSLGTPVLGWVVCGVAVALLLVALLETLRHPRRGGLWLAGMGALTLGLGGWILVSLHRQDTLLKPGLRISLHLLSGTSLEESFQRLVPARDGGLVLVRDDLLLALDREGSPRWRKRLPAGEPAGTHNPDLWAVFREDGVEAIRLESGEAVWRLPLSERPAELVQKGERVYLVGESGKVFAYDLEGRHPLWEWAPGPYRETRFLDLEDPDRLLVWEREGGMPGSWKGSRVVCLDRGTGEVLWTQEPGREGDYTPSYVRGRVLWLGQGEAFATRPPGGEVVLEFRVPGSRRSVGVVPPHVAARVEGEVAVLALVDRYFGLSLSDGRLVWRTGLYPRTLHCLGRGSRQLYFLDETGKVLAVDPFTGRLLWEHWSGGLRQSLLPAGERGMLPFFRSVGDVLLYSPPDGGSLVGLREVDGARVLEARLRPGEVVVDAHSTGPALSRELVVLTRIAEGDPVRARLLRYGVESPPRF